MSVIGEWIRYGPDGAHLGFAAWLERAAASLPAVIVIQEVWGVDPHIEDVTRRFAQAGYLAFAPDLYAQAGSRPPALARDRVLELKAFLDQLPPGAWGAMLSDAKAREAEFGRRPAEVRARLEETMGAVFGGMMSGGMRLERYLPALVAAADFLRLELPRSRGRKVGAVGFCMGGALAALLACNDPELAAAAVFYGGAPPTSLIPNLRCPVVGFYGALDRRITDGVPAFAAAMREAGKSFESHVYEDAPHAFFNDTRPSYEVRAARDSFARVLELLRRSLP